MVGEPLLGNGGSLWCHKFMSSTVNQRLLMRVSHVPPGCPITVERSTIFLMGKSTIFLWPCAIAMLKYQSVSPTIVDDCWIIGTMWAIQCHNYHVDG